MTQRIRRTMAHLAVWVVAATAGATAAGSPAQAFGAETLGCRVSPGVVLSWQNPCTNSQGAGSYNAGFSLRNLSGGGYTFSWSYSGPVLSVLSGCTSTSSDCALAVPNADGDTVVTLTYSQAGQTATRSATATITRYCGSEPC